MCCAFLHNSRNHAKAMTIARAADRLASLHKMLHEKGILRQTWLPPSQHFHVQVHHLKVPGRLVRFHVRGVRTCACLCMRAHMCQTTVIAFTSTAEGEKLSSGFFLLKTLTFFYLSKGVGGGWGDGTQRFLTAYMLFPVITVQDENGGICEVRKEEDAHQFTSRHCLPALTLPALRK